ncbi:gephyrin-like isoform X3 [Temnothorax longispinosus]|uniref:gephyrin-like isoform X3 n=1 Tax=Temnothorax longispinosus TaxID=300112 RepID=UPI003A99DFDF
MVINFEIIMVHEQDATKIDIDYNVENVLVSIPNAQIYDVTEADPVETDIMEKLLCACDENNSDVILIIGNIEPAKRQVVTDAVRNFSDSKQLSENVVLSLSKLETKLNDNLSHKAVCGVRNQSLIIDLTGSNKNQIECLAAAADTMMEVIHLICTDQDENVPLHDVVRISDNISIKQEEAKSAIKRRKKSTSPLVLSPNASTIKRHKESFPMISLQDALLKIREVIMESVEEATCEIVQLSDAYGRILFETVKAAYDLPPFKTSTKHGYAVLAADGKGLRKVLNVENTFPSISLEPGKCVWVKSGSPIPDGATAVVQVKDTKPVKISDDTYVEIMIEPGYEQNIRPIGDDLMKGTVVAIQNARIGPKEIALLAASGRKDVRVTKRISTGVLSIGSNLEEPGEEPLKPGFVYDVNRITLISLLKEKEFYSLDFGIVDNKLTPIQNKIEEALKKVDLLVTTGSTNDRDLLKTVLEKCFKADIHFGNINIKPGKSTIFATCEINDKTKFVLCLSGNPTSAFISAQMFLIPLVNELHYSCAGEQVTLSACMKNQYTLHSRPRAAWTILEWNQDEEYPSAFSRGNAISDKLVSATGANALLLLPAKESAKESSKTFATAILVKLPKQINDDMKNFCNAQLPKQEEKK